MPQLRPPKSFPNRDGQRSPRPSRAPSNRNASSRPKTVMTGIAACGPTCSLASACSDIPRRLRAGMKGCPRASRIPERMIRVSAAATPNPSVRAGKDHVAWRGGTHGRKPRQFDREKQDSTTNPTNTRESQPRVKRCQRRSGPASCRDVVSQAPQGGLIWPDQSPVQQGRAALYKRWQRPNQAKPDGL